MRCGGCHREIHTAAGERIGFRETCEGCGEDLHSCSNCGHHDPSAYNECREPQAERVADRERANRCDWFNPDTSGSERAPRPGKDLAALDALFKK